MAPDFSQNDVPDLSGRTALVTGASMGIGLEVARGLALSGARVLCLSQDPERGQEAVVDLMADIKERTGRDASIEWHLCDNRDLRGVKTAADELVQREQRLDLICANAGIGVEPPALTKDGLDVHLTVDHVGPFVSDSQHNADVAR
jgi:NAD(P)-dependent dehydrogenase (short-subunit alcohol dehydrogenase family)